MNRKNANASRNNIEKDKLKVDKFAIKANTVELELPNIKDQKRKYYKNLSKLLIR